MPRTPLPQVIPAALPFPVRGVAAGGAHAEQPQGTTPTGVNVRVFEALADRGRGGSRPGLSRYVEDQLPNVADIAAFPGLIQELNVVITADADAVPFDPVPPPPNPPDCEYPPCDVPDPIDPTPGPDTTWGNKIVYCDPIANRCVSGKDLRHRYPVFGIGRPVRRRNKAWPPNKNQRLPDELVYDPMFAFGRCIQGVITMRVFGVSPDPFGFNGTTPSFSGALCVKFGSRISVAAGATIPSTGVSSANFVRSAIATQLQGDITLPLGGGTVSAGTMLIVAMKFWLRAIGGGAQATVILDQTGEFGTTQCAGQAHPCSAPPPSINWSAGYDVDRFFYDENGAY